MTLALSPLSPAHYRLLFIVGAVLGYALLMFTNPIRTSLRDGIRCVQRYGSIWSILSVFGLCYALFELAMRVFYFYALPVGAKPVFQWSRAFFLPHPVRLDILHDSILPAAESVAGVFNNIVTTYPFSAIAALMLLFNYDGHHLVLQRALRKRFGARGWLMYFAISICAIAAILKPGLYASLTFLNHFAPGLELVQWCLVVDWLSFVFEYLFGVCIQIYLILTVFSWVRGISFTHRHLLDVAIRRFSLVVRWALVVVAASTLMIHLPLIASNVEPFSHWMPPERVVPYIDQWARPLLAAFLILFSTMQITLTFHSESLGKALGDHFTFMRRSWWPLLWYFLIAGLHFFAVNVFNQAIIQGCGDGTAITLIWRLCYPLLAALVAAWMLGTWVCLYKLCGTGSARPENWIKF